MAGVPGGGSSPFRRAFGLNASPAPRPVTSPEDGATPSVSVPVAPIPAFRRAAFGIRPRVVASQPGIDVIVAPPVVQDQVDDFVLDGFQRYDGGERPARVSPEAWDTVFPPDRPAVRTIAGRLFMGGEDPDEATCQAARQVADARWSSGRSADMLAVIGPTFPGVVGVPPPPHVASVVDSVRKTALWSWEHILDAADPCREAFIRRSWRAQEGFCLVCGTRSSGTDRRFRSACFDDEGDSIHPECMVTMKSLGPAFGRLVHEEAIRIAGVTPRPAVDQDDDVT